MAVNQYVPKYIDCKIIQKKDDGDKGFLEKDHLNAIEDNYLLKDTKIGNGTIPSGTSLIDVINRVADEAILGQSRIDSISVNSIAQTIDSNKNVDITVPVKLSDVSSDSDHRTVSDDEKNTWNLKQNVIAWQSDNYDPISNKAITKSDLDLALAPLAGTTRWRGVFNSLSEVNDPENGDIVAVGYKEYVYCSDKQSAEWKEIGDEDSYIHKGEVTNSDIRNDASISQSKIAGLIDALSEKVVKEVGKSLVLDAEIAKIHSHDNKDALDNITQDSWNGVVTNSNEVPNKVDKTTSVAGIDLQDNITKIEMLNALNVEDGAQVNEIESVKFNNSQIEIANKELSLNESDPVFTAWKDDQSVALGGESASSNCGIAIGANSSASDTSIALGKHSAASGAGAVQINGDDAGSITNDESYTLKFYAGSNKGNITVINSNGKIPSSNLDINIDQKIKDAISAIIYEDDQGGHIKISDNYTLNISSSGVITATYPVV